MASSVVIPQDIIDSIIAVVDCGLLKTCALVSSSFLIPSRKRLFSSIVLRLRNDEACQRLHQVLVGNPVVQTFVKSIWISGHWGYKPSKSLNDISLIALLRLPLCCLEKLTISMCEPFNWNDFSNDLKDALSTVIHSANLRTLYLRQVNVPRILLQGTHLTRLKLSRVSPFFDLDKKQSRLLSPATSEASHVADICQWWFYRPENQAPSLTEPISLPFVCHLRVFEIFVNPYSARMSDFNILSFMLRSLRISLSTPATLEHLKLDMTFRGYDNRLDCNAFFDDLRGADIWNHLDSLIIHPTGSRLQRVDVNIWYTFRYDDNGTDPMETAVVRPILDALPLLRQKGILFVEATNG